MVNDAWTIAPWAQVLYACEAAWWDVSGPRAAQFGGECWSSHEPAPKNNNDKTAAAEKHRLKLIDGQAGQGFSFEPNRIHYGDNSGFQAINLALQFGSEKIWLLGFDMHHNGKRHFFGDHPAEIHKDSDYTHYIGHFDTAARLLPEGIEIINATPGSALQCFPRGKL